MQSIVRMYDKRLSLNKHSHVYSIEVCNKFTSKSFRVDNYVQVSVRTPMKTGTALGCDLIPSCSRWDQIDSLDRSQSRMAIFFFLHYVADALCDRTPHQQESYFPITRKRQVHGSFNIELFSDFRLLASFALVLWINMVLVFACNNVTLIWLISKMCIMRVSWYKTETSIWH